MKKTRQIAKFMASVMISTVLIQAAPIVELAVEAASVSVGFESDWSHDYEEEHSDSWSATYEYDPPSESTDETPDGMGSTTVNIENIHEETISIDVTNKITVNLKFSSVPQLYDYEAIVYSANNQIGTCSWRPLSSDIPALEGLIMQRTGRNSVYTGFFDLDRTQPNKEIGSASRSREVMGYDSDIQSESLTGGTYRAVYMNKDVLSRGNAIMLIYKALGQYEYEYTVEPVSGVDKAFRLFTTRSNQAAYIKRAAQDNIVNPYDDNNLALKGGDFIILCAKLMQQYGEPVMNATETNMLLQLYGESVPIGFGQEVSEAYCYLKARGVLNVDMPPMENVSLDDALEVCMCIADRDSRMNYKEITIVSDLSNELVEKGYFKRDVTFDDTGIKTYETFDYSKAKVYDYFLRIDDVFPGFKTSTGQPCSTVFVSNDLDDNTHPYPGAYTKSIYEDAGGVKYYHFQVPVTYGLPYVTINTDANDDVPLYVNLPLGGGIYYLTTPTTTTGVAERMNFDSTHASEWDEFIDAERVSSATGTAVSGVRTLWDYLAMAFVPLTVHAAEFEFQDADGMQWSFTDDSNRWCRGVQVVLSVTGEIQSGDHGNYLEDTVVRTVNFMNTNEEWRKAHSIPAYQTVVVMEDNKGTGMYATSWTIKRTYPDSGSVDLLSKRLWEDAYVTVLNQIKDEREAEQQKREDAAHDKYYDTTSTGNLKLTGESFAATAICSYTGDGAMIRYKDLVAKGLFIEGVVPQPDSNGVLTLYSKDNFIVKLNQENHTMMVGSTLYQVSEDCALFYYESQTELYVDFRCAFGWGSSHKVYFAMNGNNKVVIDSSDANSIESYGKTMYTFPYDKGTSTGTGFKTLVLNSQNSAFSADHQKLLMTSAVPMANWVLYNGYDSKNSKSKAILFVYYPTVAYNSGISGILSPTQMEEYTDEAKAMQRDLLGYSVFKGDEWYIRAFDLTEATDCNTAGQFGFNSRAGMYYVVDKASTYDHKKYLNGETLLPLYSFLREGSTTTGTDYLMCANINSVDGVYGKVHDIQTIDANEGVWTVYDVFEVSESNPSGLVSTKRDRWEQLYSYMETIYGKTFGAKFSIDDLAPAAVFAYFGGFPRDYVTTGSMTSFKDGYYYIGSMGCKITEKSSAIKQYVQVQHLHTLWNIERNNSVKFYRVATDGTTSVYVLMGDTLNVSLDTGTEDTNYDEVYDAESLKQFVEFDDFSFSYLLHKIDAGTSWVIVFIYTVLPMIGICLTLILLALSFLSDNRVARAFAAKVFDPVYILTLKQARLEEWTFRRGFMYMMVAFSIMCLLFNGNILRILMWFLTWYGEIVDWWNLNIGTF